MMRYFKSPVLRTLTAVSAAYWLLAAFVPARYLIEFMDGLVIACSFMVMIVYGHKFMEGARKQHPDVLDLVITGISGAWFVTSLDRAWRLYARVTADFSLLDYPFVGYMLLLLTFFACMHLIVRGTMSNGMSNPQAPITAEAWGVIFVSLIAGSALGLLAVATDMTFRGPIK